MNENYLCDDRNVLEDVERICSMTDEEFKNHINSLKENEQKIS